MIIAMVLSVIFAGLGLVYLGDIKKGAICIALAIIFNILYYMVYPLFGIGAFIVWIYALYETYRQATGSSA